MFNPFRTPMSPARADPGTTARVGAANTAVYTDPDHPMLTTVHSNAVYLDDALYPDTTQFLDHDATEFNGDYMPTSPDYANQHSPEIHRVLLTQPNQGVDGGKAPYSFLNPAIGSPSLIEPRDTGGVAGTLNENFVEGPVTGTVMDVFQEGAFVNLDTITPGYYGPVVGRQDADAGQAATNAYYQQVIADYSVEASMPALLAAT